MNELINFIMKFARKIYYRRLRSK